MVCSEEIIGWIFGLSLGPRENMYELYRHSNNTRVHIDFNPPGFRWQCRHWLQKTPAHVWWNAALQAVLGGKTNRILATFFYACSQEFLISSDWLKTENFFFLLHTFSPSQSARSFDRSTSSTVQKEARVGGGMGTNTWMQFQHSLWCQECKYQKLWVCRCFRINTVI